MKPTKEQLADNFMKSFEEPLRNEMYYTKDKSQGINLRSHLIDFAEDILSLFEQEEPKMSADEIFEDMVVEYLDWWNNKDAEYHFEVDTRQTIKDYLRWKNNANYKKN